MEKKQFLSLIDTYINGEASENEKRLVEAYYSRLSKPAIESIETQDEELFKNVLLNRLLTQIRAESETEQTASLRLKKHINLWWISVAAILLICFSLGILFFRDGKSISKGSVDYAQLIEPGGNKAVLTLSNGSKVVLDDKSNTDIAEKNGIKIKKKENGLLEYVQLSAPVTDNQYSALFNTIETPKGGQYRIVLNDGTIVWLNAASYLRYPLQFNGAERKVELAGEGYFEVAHNAAKPFIVVTAKQEVQVLGTHFNISAYTDESVIKTTLLDGSVKVINKQGKKETGQKYLKPGEQSVLMDGSWSVREVDAAAQIDWKNGRFIFKDEDLKSVMRKLARWYDIEVDYAGSMENLSFSGKISRSKTLKEVLRILTRTNDVTFKVKERRITVMP
ncbi:MULTISPECIES: FecR family protein [unclassified Pedobacter]|uniref:FecR family protein n=1 Tax=unclassified Pedobacter TaxID=2628915 RepID=UPI0014231DFA|nr:MULTISPECIES: FecR family protein [unclassified Pedobacter]NII81137.1 ferric-dicitrate binding protein FerR (iron transport regulator) [Pedobacter sp. SG908]NMN35154.1 ferric-dicitrate binding protein FerR (iron transport regulator) [Pedobacter sp. SG918]